MIFGLVSKREHDEKLRGCYEEIGKLQQQISDLNKQIPKTKPIRKWKVFTNVGDIMLVGTMLDSEYGLRCIDENTGRVTGVVYDQKGWVEL